MRTKISFLVSAVVATAVLVPLTAVPASAGLIINVPTPYPTIQAGIDAATNGSTVVVEAGTYFEADTLDFHNKAIRVMSVSGPEDTIIDLSGNATEGVSFDEGETTSSELRGFTIQGTTTGIRIESSSPTIAENIITGLDGVFFDGFADGGAIVSTGSTSAPVITDNVITDNVITDNFSCERSPGIVISGPALVRDNVIVNNEQVCGGTGTGGGGIAITGGIGAEIDGNFIAGNSYFGGFGGGINAAADQATITDNVVFANIAQKGAGISMRFKNGLLIQNIVAENGAPGSGADGGGIHLEAGAAVSLTTGIVLVNNTVGGNVGVGVQSNNHSFTNPRFYNNIVTGGVVCGVPVEAPFLFIKNNMSTITGGACASEATSNGNISAPPQFRNPADIDYALRSTSPSKDVGDSAAPFLPPFDITGRNRIVNGVVDQGAIEFYIPKGASEPEVWLPPPARDQKRLPSGVFTAGGASVGSGVPGPAAASLPNLKSEPSILGTVTDPTALPERRQAIRTGKWRARHEALRAKSGTVSSLGLP